MRTNTPTETAAEVPNSLGLTSEDLEHATEGVPETALNLNCSEEACYVAINEFELIFLSAN